MPMRTCSGSVPDSWLTAANDLQRGAHGAFGIVLVRLWEPEVHDQPVAAVLRDVPVIALNDATAGLLVGVHQLAQHLRIEPLRQRGRADEVAEQHSELAALGVAGGQRCRNRFGPRRRPE